VAVTVKLFSNIIVMSNETINEVWWVQLYFYNWFTDNCIILFRPFRTENKCIISSAK